MPPLTYGITPDAQGRGAWTLTGGLLRGKPGATGSAGYYRLAAAAEAQIGSTWLTGKDTSDAARSVCLGTLALQRLCGLTGTNADGWYGPKTDRAVRAAQAERRLDVDGIAGRRTLRALLAPILEGKAKSFEVPVWVLAGITAKESALDPAAVGHGTPYDHGLFQINLSPTAHGKTVAVEQAMDPWWAADWSASTLKRIYDAWKGTAKADPWAVAALYHNSPRNALTLARTGEFPTDQSRRYVYGGTYTAADGRTLTEVGVRDAWEASA